MQQYLDLLDDVINNGTQVATRAKLKSTGKEIDAISVFGRQARFDLGTSFPAVTTKKLAFRSVVYELLWFIKGMTNNQWLKEHQVSIWNEWDRGDGELGPIYGKQWRAWRDDKGGTIDQLGQVIEQIRNDDLSARRRLIVSAWNVAEIPQMALPPCHAFFQFHVLNGKLSCQLYQRSADIFLGVPFNIASYALLTCLVAHVTGLSRGELVHTFGDLHLYLNHLPQAKQQLALSPYPPPRLVLNPDIKNIDDFAFTDITLEGYTSHPPLAGEVAV
jgi:thymidylate synthase